MGEGREVCFTVGEGVGVEDCDAAEERKDNIGTQPIVKKRRQNSTANKRLGISVPSNL